MTMDYLDDLDRCAGCGAVEPPQRVTLDDDLCDTFGVAGPGVACERCAEIARDRKAREALEALCLRHRCEWALDLVPARPVVILHRGGAIIGRAAGDTLADAVRAHAEILDASTAAPDRGPLPKGALYEVDAHPALAGVAYRTKRAGLAAESVRDYLDAAAGDRDGVAVRVWLTTDPRECPVDCMEG